MLIQVPWTAGFQVLVLVAGVYAFTLRLSRRPEFATAAVVIIREMAIWSQFRNDFAFLPLTGLMVYGGAVAFLLSAAYRRHGYLGTVGISLILSLRFIITFSAPPV